MNRDEQPESAPPAASPEATAPLPPAEPPPAELELPATPEHVVQAVIAATRRAGGAVEGIEPTEAAEVDEHAQPAAGGAPALEGGRGYCVATYALDPQDDEPVMTVYDLVDAGGGVTRVRIVQCGFGDQAAWDAVMERWHRRAHRRRTSTTLDFSIHRIHPYRPGGPPFPEQPPVVSPGWRAPWGGPAPGLALPRVGRGLQGDEWFTPSALRAGAGAPAHGAHAAHPAHPAALVQQLERAWAHLAAQRRRTVARASQPAAGPDAASGPHATQPAGDERPHPSPPSRAPEPARQPQRQGVPQW